jgi:hypothetical protein
MKYSTATVALGIALVVQPMTEAEASVYGRHSVEGQARLAQTIQGGADWRGGPGHHRAPDWRGGAGPRAYPGWRGGPGWRGAAPWRGPAGWTGRPYWYGRPWGPRPYYGTIIAGVALGTLITVAAVGYVPPRPAPNLCWYWADPYGNRGYWDYCG